MVENSPAKVALIQMPNGTGKTTTLRMLTATLTGIANNWRPEEVRNMRRVDDPRDRGRFRVDLIADGKKVTFELILDFDEGQAIYRTTTPSTGGVIQKWEPPPELRRFLTTEFIKLFVFDGEFADRLLSQEGNEAERAIDALCQLYLLDEVSDSAQKDWENAVRGAGASTVAGQTMALNKLEKIKKQLKRAMDAQEDARKKLNFSKHQLATLDDKIDRHILGQTNLRDQHEQAVAEREAARTLLESKLSDTMRQIRFPNSLDPSFGEALISLKDNLDRLKLPEATSRQFFSELAEEELCVCGRPLDEQTREAIIKRSKLYLGQDEAGSINALKKDIDTYCGTSVDDHPKALESSLREMIGAMNSLQGATQAVQALKQSLIENGDDALESLQKDRDKHADIVVEMEDLLADIEGEPTGSDDPEATWCLKTLNAAKKDAEAKLSKITNTLELKRQTEVIRNLADRAKEISRSHIRYALRDECNKMLKTVLRNDPLEIESIGRCLSIKNQEGASVGQTLSIGYTFLMSLLSRGNNRFPLVVDSPCGSLGAGRRETIGGLIPKLCDQFITFVIDKERDDFLPALEASCNGSIKYFTAFRNSAETEALRTNLPKHGVTRTDTAILVEDRDYFVNFKE